MNTTSQPENDATRSCAPVAGSGDSDPDYEFDPPPLVAAASTDHDHCHACGKKWADHLGMMGTCRNLQIATNQVCELERALDESRKLERKNFRRLQEERTTGDFLASALIGEFEKTEALARYAATLGDDDAQRIATAGNVPWADIKRYASYLKSLGSPQNTQADPRQSAPADGSASGD